MPREGGDLEGDHQNLVYLCEAGKRELLMIAEDDE